MGAITWPVDVALASNDPGAVVVTTEHHSASASSTDHVDVVDGRNQQIRVADLDAKISTTVSSDEPTHPDLTPVPAARPIGNAARRQRKSDPLDPTGASAKIDDVESSPDVVLPSPEDEVCALDPGGLVDCFSGELGGTPSNDEADRAEKAYEERYDEVDLLEDEAGPAYPVASGNLFDRSPLGAQVAIVLVLGICACGLIPAGLILLGSRHPARQIAATVILCVGAAGCLAGIYVLNV